ncbi:MAG TPA: hypothetical protein VK956_08570, partial [Verrucomicrobium sp.]|nr:hypothetical protein [Verrucomicrobium sp.]
MKDQKADRYYLDYADFQKLWDLAKEARKPAKPKEGEVILDTGVNLALHEVEVRELEMVVTSRLQVATRGDWQLVPLMAGKAPPAPAAWNLDGRPALLKDGGVLVEKPGMHDLTSQVNQSLPQGWRETAITLPTAIVSVLRVSVPISDGMPQI